MSESAPVTNHEALGTGLDHEIAAHTHELPTAAELAAEADHLVKAGEQSRNTANQLAETANPVERFQQQQAAAEHTAVAPPNHELKNIQARRTVQRLQRDESRPDRTLSRIIHQPVVRAVSETAAKTISRPSGLLGGGVLAFLGSTLYLYFTKHYGVTYNYFMFTILFAGGFVLGLLLELIVWSLHIKRRRTNI